MSDPGAEAKLAAVRERAEQWAALASIDNWGETTGDAEETALADCGRAILAIIDAGEPHPVTGSTRSGQPEPPLTLPADEFAAVKAVAAKLGMRGTPAVTEEAVDAALAAGDEWVRQTRAMAFVSPARDQVRAMLEAAAAHIGSGDRERMLEDAPVPGEHVCTCAHDGWYDPRCACCNRRPQQPPVDWRERAERAEAKLATWKEHRGAACAALRIAEMGARLQGGDEATAGRYRAAREALEGTEGDSGNA